MVTIGSVGAPTITLDSPVCVGVPYTHTASATNAVNLIWSFPDGSAFEGSPFQHTFTSIPATNTVMVTAVDSQGCEQDATATITVHPEPSDPFAATLDEIVCFDPGTTDIQADPGFVTYAWSDANGPIPSATSNVLSGAGEGEYFVAVTDANGCPRTSGPVTVQVLPDLSPAPILGPSVHLRIRPRQLEHARRILLLQMVRGRRADVDPITLPQQRVRHTRPDAQHRTLGHGCRRL